VLSHKKLRKCLLQLSTPELSPIERQGAERLLNKLLLQLVDSKIRHGLAHSDELEGLAHVVLDRKLDLDGSSAILLDHFRYRLAHVAMRSRNWMLALSLLEPVIRGRKSLRMARIYQALCNSRLEGSPLAPGELQNLVNDLVSPVEPDGPGPMDLVVQDSVTNMAELFLLLQDAPEHVIDSLYDTSRADLQERGLTSGLSLFLVPEGGQPAHFEIGEWLAMQQLSELESHGWLIVDCTVSLGDLGRGSPVKNPRGEPNKKQLQAILQVLAQSAPQSLDPRSVRDRFFDQAGTDLVGEPGSEDDHGPGSENPVAIERATTGLLITHNRKVIQTTDRRWTLMPPYAVVKKDSRRALHQVLSSPQ